MSNFNSFANALAGFGAGVQGNGQQFLKQQQENETRSNLSQLGANLASGNIDQAQYLKGVAQYDPELYGKMSLAQLQNTPAALQMNNAIQKALGSGDYDTANRLAWLQRSQAYGVNTFDPNQKPYGPAPAANNPALQNYGNPSPAEAPLSATPQATAAPNIAQQQANNAALKKQAEADAANKSDLKYKPQIAGRTEEEKQRAEREGISPKELETKRSQAYVAALEAAPLLKTLKDLNEGTIDAPYAAAFQPILKMSDSQKATNLDLMKQARIELAAPLAKQLGVNPTDKDFEASLDRIFDISSTKDSRAAQIKALTSRVMNKPDLYNTDKQTGAEKAAAKLDAKYPTKKIGEQTYINKDGKWFEQ